MTTAAWIYWIAGAALGGVGFYLASWALLSDWLAGHRKQRRCAKCWYDTGAVVGIAQLHDSRRFGTLRWEGWTWESTLAGSDSCFSVHLRPQAPGLSC